MDKQTAIEKIRKCLALAKSANEHEAAAALRQAQALMRKYGVEDGDILMAEVSEARVKAGAKTKPVKWKACCPLPWRLPLVAARFLSRSGKPATGPSLAAARPPKWPPMPTPC